MPAQVKTFNKPMRMVYFADECMYCGSPGHTHYNHIQHQLGFITCDAHKDLADRDADAYLALKGRVRFDEATEDQLFVLGTLLTRDIKVRRSSGAIDDNWRIREPSCEPEEGMTHFVARDPGHGIKWYMQAIQPSTGTTRGFCVDDLKLSLPEDQHSLVDAFVARLDAGFYKAQLDAHNAAVAAAQTAGQTQ